MLLEYKTCGQCKSKYTSERAGGCPVCLDKEKISKPNSKKNQKTIAVSDCCKMGYAYLGTTQMNRMCLDCKQSCGIKVIKVIKVIKKVDKLVEKK